MKNKKRWRSLQILSFFLCATAIYFAWPYPPGGFILFLVYLSLIIMLVAGEKAGHGIAVDLDALKPGSTVKLHSFVNNPDEAIFETEGGERLFVKGLLHRQTSFRSDFPPHIPKDSVPGTEFIVTEDKDGITALSPKK